MIDKVSCFHTSVFARNIIIEIPASQLKLLKQFKQLPKLKIIHTLHLNYLINRKQPG